MVARAAEEGREGQVVFVSQGSVANVRMEQPAASLQNHAVLAEMLGRGDEVMSYPRSGKAQGIKPES